MRFLAELQVSEASASSRVRCRRFCSYATSCPDVGGTGMAVQRVLRSPPQVFDEVPSMENLQEILPLLSPKQLADAIRNFAKQGKKPADELLQVIAQEVKSKLEHFRSQDLSNTAWALAMLKYKPDAEWWSLFDKQVQKNTTDFSCQDLTNLMWALAVLDHRPPRILDSVLCNAADHLSNYSASSLHIIIWAAAKLGHCPSPEWMDKFLSATQTSFFQFTPSEMSNMIWALVKLGPKLPSMWLDNFLMVAQWRFPSFSAKLLSIIVWSAAMLEHRPSQEWMLGFEEQVREKFEEFSGQELACIAWALREFGHDAEHNAVLYMLGRQERFLELDYEILSNPQLLGQVLNRQQPWQSSSGGAESA
eukprot:gene21008-27867_t